MSTPQTETFVDFLVKELLRAGSDTAILFELRMRTFLIVALCFGLGLVMHYKIRGGPATKDELATRIILDVAPTAVIFTLLFLFNFIRSPYLLYSESKQQANQKIQELTQERDQVRSKNTEQEEEIAGLKSRSLEGEKGGARHGLDDNAQIEAAIHKVLSFPNAVQDLTAPPTIVETLLTDQTPRKLFNVLVLYDENAVGAVPGSGPVLRDFLHKYYQFERNTAQLENELLTRIGSMVPVRFREGWTIYLRYAILRFGGMSKDQVIAGGNFLNFDITWDDSERVYGQLLSDPVIAKKFSDAFSQYKGFVETTKKLTANER